MISTESSISIQSFEVIRKKVPQLAQFDSSLNRKTGRKKYTSLSMISASFLHSLLLCYAQKMPNHFWSFSRNNLLPFASNHSIHRKLHYQTSTFEGCWKDCKDIPTMNRSIEKMFKNNSL
jgi:hypothetical protein